MITNLSDDYNMIKIVKKLGEGTFGKTYLVKYNNKRYALKVQYILKKETKKTFKNKMWRELDLFHYISTLKNDEKKFFVHLYKFDISNDCYQNTIDKNNSSICIQYLMDYVGDYTLDKYISKYYISRKKKLSILLQLIKIILILYKGCYSHNDLHVGTNIMIIKTKKKYFTIGKHKIPFYGIQCVAIDYGEVAHKKFCINYKKHPFKKMCCIDPKKHVFTEIFNATYFLLNKYNQMIEDCIDSKKKFPWQRKNVWSNGMKKLMNKHEIFFKDCIEKYGLIYPEHKKNLQYLFDNRKSKKSIEQLILDKNITKGNFYNIYDYFYNILRRINEEFQYYYPELYMKYFGWCKIQKIDIPEKYFLRILHSSNYEEIVDVYIDMLYKK